MAGTTTNDEHQCTEACGTLFSFYVQEDRSVHIGIGHAFTDDDVPTLTRATNAVHAALGSSPSDG
ncbi:hypothetical protein GCM10009613_11650 [Pseudonocardia kongjuensis]|uniref:Uncharacterized protein n=1 Tax=Pseudonocardia kongjuensis TaxID=102227 RepID=A0ABN1XJS5_9PSEU